MKRRTIRVTEEWAGLRLDACLAQAVPELSRAQVQRLLRAGKVAGPKPLKPSDRVQTGWQLVVEWADTPVTITPSPVEFNLVFADDDLAVIDKPAGLVVHPAPGNYDHTLVHGLLDRFGGLANLGAPLRPGIVHRLDKETSGLLVVARTDRAYQSLTEQIARREAGREYIAIVCGHLPTTTGSIGAAIGRSRRDRRVMRVDRRGKEAETHFRVTEKVGPCDLLHLTLGSGRTHQIRVHLRHVGKPVLGDPTYGGRSRWATTLSVAERQKVQRVLKDLKRQALHAHRLSFRHPRTEKPLQFESSIPEDMANALTTLRA